MKLILSFFISTILLATCASCQSKQQKRANQNTENATQDADVNDNQQSEENNTEENKTEEDAQSNEGDCKFKDGTYSASVDYTNPETGYSANYTLDVEVQDCQVVQIDFPKGGWLDEDHISAADIDEDGNASVDGEEGKTYEVHIDE